ncbi:MAG: lysophospholipid acyltransferase family protein [Planctomycetes bacterium]|nr:lysophospholipid acyltransferase family protein [Planctomycetota bacterium]
MFGLLARSWRVERIEGARFEGLERGFILALWHGRMLLGIRELRAERLHVLVSMSGDGDVSEALLQNFGYTVVRGSRSRGGARALREMLGILGEGGVVVITPDGPRGPRHTMNPGLAWMAKATGYPVLPLGYAVDRAWRLKSWDRFTIPKPFARVRLAFGEPVRVPREATPEDMERATESIRERLLELERRGFASLGTEPDF